MRDARKMATSSKTTGFSLFASLVLLASLATVAALALLSPACSKKSSVPGSSAASTASPPLPADFPSGKPCFVRVPPPADWSKMNWLRRPPPAFELAHKWGPLYDLRQAYLSRLDLTAHAQALLNSFFDT